MRAAMAERNPALRSLYESHCSRRCATGFHSWLVTPSGGCLGGDRRGLGLSYPFPLSPRRGLAPVCSLAGPPLVSAGWEPGHWGRQPPGFRGTSSASCRVSSLCPHAFYQEESQQGPCSEKPAVGGVQVKDQTALLSRRVAVLKGGGREAAQSSRVLAGEA